MNSEEIRKKILELAEPLVEAQGLEIWGLELTGMPPKNVRLFVDVPSDESLDSAGSATIEQCEDISRQLGLALDVEDWLSGPWTLEVSSPGLERIFFRLAQMEPFLGDIVEVLLKEPVPIQTAVPGRSVWTGKLLAVDKAAFQLEPCQISAEGDIAPENIPPVTIPWDQVKKARRKFVFQTPKKPGKKRSGKAR